MNKAVREIKILLIIRDQAMGELISDILLHNGYLVACVGDLQRGRSLLGKDNFATAIIDAQLPHLQVAVALKMFKRHYPGIPTIVVSNNPSFTAVRRIIKMGAYDYITIPFNSRRTVFCSE